MLFTGEEYQEEEGGVDMSVGSLSLYTGREVKGNC
jgi:hypothetical protein